MVIQSDKLNDGVIKLHTKKVLEELTHMATCTRTYQCGKFVATKLRRIWSKNLATFFLVFFWHTFVEAYFWVDIVSFIWSTLPLHIYLFKSFKSSFDKNWSHAVSKACHKWMMMMMGVWFESNFLAVFYHSLSTEQWCRVS